MEQKGRKMTGGRPPAERLPSAPRPHNNRAAVTNGRLLPRGIDGRSVAGRRWKDLYREFASQMPPGAPSAAREARLRSLVGVTVALERVGSQQARGEPVDHAELVSLANSQGRLMQELGLAPKLEPEPERAPSLAEYLAAKREAEP